MSILLLSPTSSVSLLLYDIHHSGTVNSLVTASSRSALLLVGEDDFLKNLNNVAILMLRRTTVHARVVD